MGTRITREINPFNAYITSTDNFLQAISSGIIHNWERLGLGTADAAEWHTRRQAWDTLFTTYNDASLRTSIITTQVHNFIESFREFAGPQLNIMAASMNATEVDEGIFNFVITPSNPTHSTTPIDDEVSVVVKHKGGGTIDFKCTDSEGTAKAAGSDSVQMAWMILEEGVVPPGPGPTPPPDGTPDPDDVEMAKEIFTKSHFEKHFGTQNLKKRVVCYFRWYNTKHPDLAGPWTDILAIVIA